MTAIALQADGLHTFYGKSHILHGVGLEVREGEIVTLLGRNGAGKTTTLRSLIGLTHARDGSVSIFGRSTRDWPAFRIAALGVGYVPEGRRIFSNLTVEENLKVPLERPGPWTVSRPSSEWRRGRPWDRCPPPGPQPPDRPSPGRSARGGSGPPPWVSLR